VAKERRRRDDGGRWPQARRQKRPRRPDKMLSFPLLFDREGNGSDENDSD